MEYIIYQMPPSLRREFNAESKIDRKNYVPVYKGYLEIDFSGRLINENVILDELFFIFNINPPEGYISYSMSIGDVVELIIGDEKKYFVCQLYGWKEIKIFS